VIRALIFIGAVCLGGGVPLLTALDKPRVLVTTDGEVDDQCSMVRFLLYANEWDIEGIILSSSQYHWRGRKSWSGDDWMDPYLEAYAKVHPKLILHDPDYPAPGLLRARTLLGNVDAEGEMENVTPGSQRIVEVLLDARDPRPVWIQAWGGTNTIARALKTIEEDHPDRMAEVAGKVRFYFIWEQDETYQSYIRPKWGKYGIPTIIADQFWGIAYQWNKILPDDKKPYFQADWMKANILEGRGELCALYQAHVPGSHGLSGDTDFSPGDFRSEGDSPAFLHTIPTGLRNGESPGYGGWGGRFTLVRENTWLDPVPVAGYQYPQGRWYTRSAWGRNYMREQYPESPALMREYFDPIARWTDAIQRDFAARAAWCVKSYEEANHPPLVELAYPPDLKVRAGEKLSLRAKATDPDGDELSFRWWHDGDAGSHPGGVEVGDAGQREASLVIPQDAQAGARIHVICEVTDHGSPPLTRYQRVILTVGF
jgi:hypothetical protein